MLQEYFDIILSLQESECPSLQKEDSEERRKPEGRQHQPTAASVEPRPLQQSLDTTPGNCRIERQILDFKPGLKILKR